MARVLTQNISVEYAVEDAAQGFGLLQTGSPTPVWKLLEPNEIAAFGAEIKTVSRLPISVLKQRRQGTLVDLDAKVGLKVDWTQDSFIDFMEGFVFARAVGFAHAATQFIAAAGKLICLQGQNAISGGQGANLTGAFTGSWAVVVGSLIRTRGATNAGNNALNKVTTVTNAVDATDTVTCTAGNAADGDTVTLTGPLGGARIYRFKTVAVLANDVKIGGTNDITLTNLQKAINASGLGDGTDYFAGTTINLDVNAGSEAAGSLNVNARLFGVAGNSITAAKVGANLGVGTANFVNGVDGFLNASAAAFVNETPSVGQNSTVEVAGFRSTAGDLAITVGGIAPTMTSVSIDFTTLGLTVGQFIYVGGVAAITQFSTAANNGYLRIVSIAAHTLTFDKALTTWVIEAGAAQTVDLYFGRFIRNVPVTDTNYIARQFMFEATYPDLSSVGVPMYEYMVGNYCNTVAFTLPLANKATADYEFIGTDVVVPSTTRKTGASTPQTNVMTEAMNTTSDIGRLRIAQYDQTGLSTDFKKLTLKLNNHVSPEKVIAKLGPKYMNSGIFEVDLDSELLFTSGAVVTAIRNNTTCTCDFSVQNGDGGVVIDIPAMNLGDGKRTFPLNMSVLIAVKGMAFIDPTLQTSLSASIFPFVPNAT